MSNAINTITKAFEAMAASAADYSHAADKIRAIRARGEVEEKEVRELAQAALLAKVPGYRAQCHPESGKPAKGSAYQRAVSRMMADTNPNKGEHANHTAAVRVPRELQAAVDKLLTRFAAKLIREAIKRAA
jgi:hypothetical protein